MPNGVTVTLTTLTRSFLVRIQVRQPAKKSSHTGCFFFAFLSSGFEAAISGSNGVAFAAAGFSPQAECEAERARTRADERKGIQVRQPAKKSSHTGCFFFAFSFIFQAFIE